MAGQGEPSGHKGVSGLQPDLGRKLKQARSQAGLSLTEVAKTTQLSASFLSMVENGISDIAIGRLHRLTQHYRLDIGALLNGPLDPEPADPGSREILDWPDEGIRLEFLASGPLPLRPVLVHFEPGGGMTEPIRGAGDAVVYVLSGRVEIDLDSEIAHARETVVLGAGGCLYLTGDRSRLYRSVSDGPTDLLTVVLADHFRPSDDTSLPV